MYRFSQLRHGCIISSSLLVHHNLASFLAVAKEDDLNGKIVTV
jgi:hypothetical protein